MSIRTCGWSTHGAVAMCASLLTAWAWSAPSLRAFSAHQQAVPARQAMPPAAVHTRSVFVNTTRLADDVVAALERQYRTKIRDGRYWYDPKCGAWGLEGGPGVGLLPPGLKLGGPLRADASNGRTGVFINGRQLHALDVAALQQLGPVFKGRYWLDALGNVGYENGPAILNLVQLINAAQRRGASGGRRSVLSTWDRTGVAVFGY